MQRLVLVLVLSRLDYCNSLLFSLPANTLAPLQRIINAAARLVARLGPRTHVIPAMCELHWLPVMLQINFKERLMMFHVVNG
jgi:hypothetical protein